MRMTRLVELSPLTFGSGTRGGFAEGCTRWPSPRQSTRMCRLTTSFKWSLVFLHILNNASSTGGIRQCPLSKRCSRPQTQRWPPERSTMAPQRCGTSRKWPRILHRPDHPVVGVEEDHVEGHACVFHPERMVARLGEGEEHPAVARQPVAKHEPLADGFRGASVLQSQGGAVQHHSIVAN